MNGSEISTYLSVRKIKWKGNAAAAHVRRWLQCSIWRRLWRNLCNYRDQCVMQRCLAACKVYEPGVSPYNKCDYLSIIVVIIIRERHCKIEQLHLIPISIFIDKIHNWYFFKWIDMSMCGSSGRSRLDAAAKVVFKIWAHQHRDTKGSPGRRRLNVGNSAPVIGGRA